MQLPGSVLVCLRQHTWGLLLPSVGQIPDHFKASGGSLSSGQMSSALAVGDGQVAKDHRRLSDRPTKLPQPSSPQLCSSSLIYFLPMITWQNFLTCIEHSQCARYCGETLFHLILLIMRGGRYSYFRLQMSKLKCQVTYSSWVLLELELESKPRWYQIYNLDYYYSTILPSFTSL